MKIYVASSWRNEYQPGVVQALRQAGHTVYDFRNPTSNNHGFHWSEIDPDWQQWTPTQFSQALEHPIAVAGFGADWAAMRWADACALVLPCGRSAHLEAGYFVGSGKPLYLLLADGEPELMYKMATGVYTNLDDLLEAVNKSRWYEDPLITSLLIERERLDNQVKILGEELHRLRQRYGNS